MQCTRPGPPRAGTTVPLGRAGHQQLARRAGTTCFDRTAASWPTRRRNGGRPTSITQVVFLVSFLLFFQLLFFFSFLEVIWLLCFFYLFWRCIFTAPVKRVAYPRELWTGDYPLFSPLKAVHGPDSPVEGRTISRTVGVFDLTEYQLWQTGDQHR